MLDPPGVVLLVDVLAHVEPDEHLLSVTRHRGVAQGHGHPRLVQLSETIPQMSFEHI